MSSSVKNVMGILIGIALNLWISLGSMDISTLILPIHEHGISVRYLYPLQFPSSINSFQHMGLLPPWLSVLLDILFFLMQL